MSPIQWVQWFSFKLFRVVLQRLGKKRRQHTNWDSARKLSPWRQWISRPCHFAQNFCANPTMTMAFRQTSCFVEKFSLFIKSSEKLCFLLAPGAGGVTVSALMGTSCTELRRGDVCEDDSLFFLSGSCPKAIPRHKYRIFTEMSAWILTRCS